AERRLRVAVDEGAARFDRRRQFGHALAARAAAVEADEGIAFFEGEAGAVQKLLDGVSRSEDVRRLADLERTFGCRPLVRPGADEVEPARRKVNSRTRPIDDRSHGLGHSLELELGAEDAGQL